MVNLTDEQYAAIGRVAVESGTLEREVEEYLAWLQVKLPSNARTLGPKLSLLQKSLFAMPVSAAAIADFKFTTTALLSVVEQRNAVVHGVWGVASNASLEIGNTTVKGRAAELHAKEIKSLAKKLRIGRKLLLRLLHENCTGLVSNKKPPQRPAHELKQKLLSA